MGKKTVLRVAAKISAAEAPPPSMIAPGAFSVYDSFSVIGKPSPSAAS